MVLGPYTSYVFSAYAISLGVLAAAVILTARAWRKARRTLRELGVEVSETKV